MVADIPQIFDREVYRARQAKASAAQAPLLAQVAEDLEARLAVINHRFEQVAVIAGAAEPFRSVLAASGKCGAIEIVPPQGDEALALEAGAYELVLHGLDLHCVNDVPGQLAQCARALRPDGLFMACCFAADTLQELRQSWLAAESSLDDGASLRVAPMIGVREMGSLLQRAGLALPVTDVDHLTLRYGDGLALMREIKAFGFANPLLGRRKSFTSRRMLLACAQDYQLHYADGDGRVRATLDILWAMAWKPHASQPQPKKPGSATARLADVLKTLDDEA